MKPDPIEPLDYARPTPLPRWTRFIPSQRARRITRLVYLIVCCAGLFFAIRFLLHYKSLIEDAMKTR